MERVYLKPMKFSGRMGKYTINTYYIDLISREGNLKDILLKAKMKDFTKSMFKDIMGDEMWKEKLSTQEKIEKFKLFKDKIEQRYKQDIDNFLPILFNQTLVIICTIFDIFLEDCLKVITKLRPETVKLLSTKEDEIILKSIEKKTNCQIVFDVIRKKILQKFSFKGIKKKINIFELLGLKRDILFKLNPKMSLKYPDAYGFLSDVYKKRNDIVHKNALSLKTYQELSNIDMFFSHFTLKLALNIQKHFNIPIDIQLFASDESIELE